jgi:hypothetical protein
LVTAGLWYVDQGWWGKEWSGFLAMGFMFGQVMNLAAWLALGDGKWYWRLVMTAFATVLLAQTFSWAEIIAQRGNLNDPADWPRLVLLTVLLIGFTALWPLRQFAKWRLTWQPAALTTPAALQFSTRDLLLWMVVIGGALGALRILDEVTSESASGLFRFVFQLLGMVALIAAALATAFGRDIFFRRLAILCALTLLISGASTGLVIWNRYSAMPANLPRQLRLDAALRISVPESLSFLAATASALMNGIALRALGCTLIRPTILVRNQRQTPELPGKSQPQCAVAEK